MEEPTREMEKETGAETDLPETEPAAEQEEAKKAAEAKEAEAAEETAEDGKERKFFKKKKDKKDEKIEELTDRLTRQMAEFDNFRKRTEKEKANMYAIGALAEVLELSHLPHYLILQLVDLCLYGIFLFLFFSSGKEAFFIFFLRSFPIFRGFCIFCGSLRSFFTFFRIPFFLRFGFRCVLLYFLFHSLFCHACHPFYFLYKVSNSFISVFKVPMTLS